MASTSSLRKRKTVTTPSTSFFNLKRLTPPQKTIFTRLRKRSVQTTAFACHRTLKRLGILRPVTRLLGRVGLDGFLNEHAHTYYSFMFEFLATLKKGNDPSKPRGEESRHLTFNLNDKTHTMFYDELEEVFGWESSPIGNFSSPTGFNAQEFYRGITHFFKFDRNTLISSIPHPALRFVAFFIEMPIFCRAEANKLPLTTLKALWAMTPEGNDHPHWAALWVDACLDLVDESKKGTIAMGGMVTLIYEYLERKKGKSKKEIEYPEFHLHL